MDKGCPVHQAAGLAGRKWMIILILELYKGDEWKRYSRLKNKVAGITPKMLSMRLRELEKQKLVKRRVDAKRRPIISEYALTEKGRDFMKVILEMKKWIARWDSDITCGAKDCRKCMI